MQVFVCCAHTQVVIPPFDRVMGGFQRVIGKRVKGVNSGLRLVYAYFEADATIIFIERYHKSDKANEDRNRILRNFS